MGKITLKNGKGQKVEITFKGEAHVNAHKENKGMVILNASFYFDGTDQKYDEAGLTPESD